MPKRPGGVGSGEQGVRRTSGPHKRPTKSAASLSNDEKVGGVLGVLGNLGADLGDAAVNLPSGLWETAESFGSDIGRAYGGDLSFRNTRDLAGEIADQYAYTYGPAVHGDFGETAHRIGQHPLGPILDAATVLTAGAGAAAKTAQVSRATTLGEAARALVTKANPEARILKVGNLEAEGQFSRNPVARGVQRATDAALQKGADKSLRIEDLRNARVAKWEGRRQRVTDAVAREPGTRLRVMGRKLKPEEWRALRLVAEEVPVARRIGASEMRKARAKGSEVARHQERIDLTRKAAEFLDEGPDGLPTFKPEATKLRSVYQALRDASTDRESMLRNLDLMDEDAQATAKTKVARIAAGARTVSSSEARANAKAIRDQLRAEGIRGADMADSEIGAISAAEDQAGKLVGAEDITASPNAVFIGNPVEHGRLSGKPRVSSTGTFGHTRKPSSLKSTTGGSVEHALERNDVTGIVAERHAEAVRLSTVDRVRKRLAQAGEASPRRPDDVFVWTNDLVSNERIPAEVRSFLNSPDSIAKIAPDEQVSIADRIKHAVFQTEDWRNPEKVAEFEQLARQGKGVFVPKRLLGEFGKRDYNLGAVPGVKFVDAVNNAQKAGLVYLKANYPIIQGISNVAMNLIQQGFLAPANLTRAIRLNREIGPELTAVLDDIMGQGAVIQAGFEGTGRVATMSKQLAHFMSSKVDTPSRRAAFLHEARIAGYGKGAKFKQLLTDDTKINDLVNVSQRAKEAIVDFGEMGQFEQQIARRLIFVYPWQKGATKYAAHFLRDHPIQANVLANLGEIGQQQSAEDLGPVPSYLQGVFRVGDGLVNPAGVNFFQTPAQIGEAVSGVVTGNAVDRGKGMGFLSPGPGILAAMLTGHDDIGRPLDGNVLGNVRDLTYGATPLARMLRAAAGDSPAVRTLVGDSPETKTFPNSTDAFWNFLIGGLHKREYSRSALNQNAARERLGR